MKSILSLLVLICALHACNQPKQQYDIDAKSEATNGSDSVSFRYLDSTRHFLGKACAEDEVRAALAGKPQRKLNSFKTMVLADSLAVVKFAETTLFSTYGRDIITKQRPYECYLIDNYWFVRGTLPESTPDHLQLGGVFQIIIDARDSAIVQMIHGR